MLRVGSIQLEVEAAAPRVEGQLQAQPHHSHTLLQTLHTHPSTLATPRFCVLTDRLTDRLTDWQTERWKDRQAGRQADRQTGRQARRQKQTEGQIEAHRGRQLCKWVLE